MEFLIGLVVLIVVVAVVYALLQWSALPVPPVVYQVAGIILVGIVLVVIIRWLWPILLTGELPGLR